MKQQSNDESRGEIPVVFSCKQNELLGVIHHAGDRCAIGMLIVVGGAQYRAGAHRQFVLLARKLASVGVSVMRFDQRGTGDASGEKRAFDQINNDIKCAIDVFMQQCPHLSGVVIWGLCDAASAALFYGNKDNRVQGLILLNPWVQTNLGEAKTYLKYYYLQHLASLSFWRNFFTLKVDYLKSAFSLMRSIKELTVSSALGFLLNKDKKTILPDQLFDCLSRFPYPVLFILSGHDLTADQFRELVKSDPKWKNILTEQRISKYNFPAADHTFSSAIWRDQVADWTLDWLIEVNTNGK